MAIVGSKLIQNLMHERWNQIYFKFVIMTHRKVHSGYDTILSREFLTSILEAVFDDQKNAPLCVVFLNKKFCYKGIAPSTFCILLPRNANLHSCNRGTLQNRASCKLNRLQNLTKPKHTSDKKI